MKIKLLSFYIILILISIINTDTIYANSHSELIVVDNTSIEINFPENLKFSISGSSSEKIEKINIVLKIGYSNSKIIQPLQFIQKNDNFTGHLLWKTNTSSRYIPPGSPIEFFFNITTKSGYQHMSSTKDLIYLDNNKKWSSTSLKSITMYFNEVYGNVVKNRAQELLETTLQTVESISPLLGLESDSDPLNIVLFNDYSYMSKSLAPKSETQEEKLVTQGQAFPSYGVVLLLDSMQSKGTASHEITHILVQRAAGSSYNIIPAWLNEGIAEYANPIIGFAYQNSYETNLANNSLLSITKYTSPPGKPEDVILFYGQSEKLVDFMINKLEPKNFTSFIKNLKNGMSINNALIKVYGMNKTEIENKWREEIGTNLIKETNKKNQSTTPSNTIQLYTLDDMKVKSEEISKSEVGKIEDLEDSKKSKIKTESTNQPTNNMKNNSCGLSDSNEILMVFSIFTVAFIYRKNKKR